MTDVAPLPLGTALRPWSILVVRDAPASSPAFDVTGSVGTVSASMGHAVGNQASAVGTYWVNCPDGIYGAPDATQQAAVQAILADVASRDLANTALARAPGQTTFGPGVWKWDSATVAAGTYVLDATASPPATGAIILYLGGYGAATIASGVSFALAGGALWDEVFIVCPDGLTVDAETAPVRGVGALVVGGGSAPAGAGASFISSNTAPRSIEWLGALYTDRPLAFDTTASGAEQAAILFEGLACGGVPAGTLVATTAGPKAVEALARGDLVVGAYGSGANRVARLVRHQNGATVSVPQGSVDMGGPSSDTALSAGQVVRTTMDGPVTAAWMDARGLHGTLDKGVSDQGLFEPQFSVETTYRLASGIDLYAPSPWDARLPLPDALFFAGDPIPAGLVRTNFQCTTPHGARYHTPTQSLARVNALSFPQTGYYEWA
jgi:hypothetical protein